ncbi:unnamed protein product [Medioppia subpectinata]|uniref:Cytochrome P450 n=1 Tax=Medioppia subpectinata TaxID=1979941 RepID=A0A7R9KSP2_9ACAR|nr:unnamed protein product [Medioppia subpectinata]CAG2109133.1 unnamed protein product [Medioppia subpectinata]
MNLDYLPVRIRYRFWAIYCVIFKSKDHWDVVLRQVAKQYGPVFTFWFGTRPQVMITDIDLGREAFRKNDMAASNMSNEKCQDVVSTDYGPQWEALRRVAHSAVHHEYFRRERLFAETIDIVKGKYIKHYDDYNESIERDFCDALISAKNDALRDGKESAPYLTDTNLSMAIFDIFLAGTDTTIMNFCDALISAKNDALRDGKESAPYLTDTNLSMAIFDIFLAGTDTSQHTFQWIVLLMSYYPEMQQKLRQEIESQIGDRMPTHEDRNRCHYVMAFIAETLRFRNVVPTGLPHKTLVDTKLDKYTIPKNMSVFVYQSIICRNDKDWQNSDEFKPERFIDSEGQFITTRPKAFIPFGVGRRVCLGEKLAIADLFLVLVRFLQSTQDYDIVLDSNGGIEYNPNTAENLGPSEYRIKLIKLTMIESNK